MIEPISSQTAIIDPGSHPAGSYLDWAPMLASLVTTSTIKIVLTSFQIGGKHRDENTDLVHRFRW